MKAQIIKYSSFLPDAIKLFLIKYVSKRFFVLPFKHEFTDFLIVSYPKCGRTWVRMMLGEYLNLHFNLNLSKRYISEVQHFYKLNQNVPKIEIKHLGYEHNLHYLKVGVDKEILSKSKIIFIFRSPLAVAVSYFYHVKYRRSDIQINPNINEFVSGDYSGVKTIVNYFNAWHEIYQSNPNKMLLQSYENYKQNAHNELYGLIGFLGIQPIEEYIKIAVNNCSIENLSKNEVKGILNSKRFGGKSENSRKVRKGNENSWKESVNSEVAEEMSNYIQQNLLLKL